MLGTLYTLSHLIFPTRSPFMETEEQEDNNDSKATQLQMIEAEFNKMYCSAAYFDNVLHWSVCILSSVLTERL